MCVFPLCGHSKALVISPVDAMTIRQNVWVPGLYYSLKNYNCYTINDKAILWYEAPTNSLMLTMCLTAETTWAKTSFVSRSFSLPLVVIRENKSPPLPYSITRCSFLLLSITSYKRTMFGWHSFSMQLISAEVKCWLFLSRRDLSMILTATLSETEEEGDAYLSVWDLERVCWG